MHEELRVAAPAAVTDVAAVGAGTGARHLAAAELLPGEVAADPARAPGGGGAGHGGGEVDRLLHIRTVGAEDEMLRVNGIL